MKMKHVNINGTLYRLPNNHIIIATYADLHTNIATGIKKNLASAFLMNIKLQSNFLKLFTEYYYKHSIKTTNKLQILNYIILKKKYHQIYMNQMMLQYINDIIITLKHHNKILIGPNLLAHLNFIANSKMHALYCGMNYVRPIDIQNVAIDTLSHHIILKNIHNNTKYLYHSKYIDELQKNIIRNIILHIIQYVIKPNIQ